MIKPAAQRRIQYCAQDVEADLARGCSDGLAAAAETAAGCSLGRGPAGLIRPGRRLFPSPTNQSYYISMSCITYARMEEMKFAFYDYFCFSTHGFVI